MIRETVYKGRDNPAIVPLASTKSSTPLAGVTRVVCTLSPSGVVVDSAVDAAAITWTGTAFTFVLGDYPASGVQAATVDIYDPLHPDGQTVIHPQSHSAGKLAFVFV